MKTAETFHDASGDSSYQIWYVSEVSITNGLDITKIFKMIGYSGGRTLGSRDLLMSNVDGISCRNSCQKLKLGEVGLTLRCLQH